MTDIDWSVHAQQGAGRSWAGSSSQILGEPAEERRVAGFARHETLHIHRFTPFAFDLFIFLLAALWRWRPGVLGTPDSFGEGAEQDQGLGSLWVGCGKGNAKISSFRKAKQGGPLRPG